MNVFNYYYCEWLIIVVIKELYSNIFKEIVDGIIQEMEDAGSRHNQVLLIQDKIRRSGSEKLDFNTSFQRLIQDEKNPEIYKFKDVPSGDVDFEYENSRSWAELLRWINKTYSAKRTVMVVQSHGCGFGVSGDKEKWGPGNLEVKFNETIYITGRFGYYLNTFFSKSCKTSFIHVAEKDSHYEVSRTNKDDYCKNLEMLWVTELEEALASSFGSRKIDVLMMVNCYMQTFDTGWILKSRVKYLVAPESVFQAYGYSFKSLLQTLNNKPRITTRNLIATIKPDFVSKWLALPDVGQKGLNRVVVVITNLRYYGILKLLFEQVAKRLAKCSNEELDRIKQVRANIINVTKDPGGTDNTKVAFIDLIYLFEQIRIAFPGKIVLNTCIKLFNKLARRSIADKYIGENFTKNDATSQKKYSINGISIFLPLDLMSTRSTSYANCAYFGKMVLSETDNNRSHTPVPLEKFTKTSRWDEFIMKYLQQLSENQPPMLNSKTSEMKEDFSREK